MQIRFWGVRGSIAAPGPVTVHYGGNTSCVEVKHDGCHLIFDAGTGIRALGRHLSRQKRGQSWAVHVLLSHFHIDHVCGLPFFRPLFEENVTLHLYGPKGYRRSFRSIIASFFSEEFFPVPLSQIPSKLRFHALGNKSFCISPFQIESFYINHPGKTVGYVVQTQKKKMAYLCDHEPIGEYQHLKHPRPAAYEKKLLQALKGVDVLIHDAQFSDEEYSQYRGWGHSPWSYTVDLAHQAGVKQLVLFHHAPDHGDAQLTEALNVWKRRLRRHKSSLRLTLAREGETIAL